jgi:sirohydrochlorin ferrochelatase
MTKDKRALLLIAHGSRREEANADLSALVTEMRNQGEFDIVEGAFLELEWPTIEEMAHRCVGKGAQRVVLAPYFLSAGVHVRQHLADTRAKLSKKYPETEFVLAEPLGLHPLLFEIVAQRAREAL